MDEELDKLEYIVEELKKNQLLIVQNQTAISKSIVNHHAMMHTRLMTLERWLLKIIIPLVVIIALLATAEKLSVVGRFLLTLLT